MSSNRFSDSFASHKILSTFGFRSPSVRSFSWVLIHAIFSNFRSLVSLMLFPLPRSFPKHSFAYSFAVRTSFSFTCFPTCSVHPKDPISLLTFLWLVPPSQSNNCHLLPMKDYQLYQSFRSCSIDSSYSKEASCFSLAMLGTQTLHFSKSIFQLLSLSTKAFSYSSFENRLTKKWDHNRPPLCWDSKSIDCCSKCQTFLLLFVSKRNPRKSLLPFSFIYVPQSNHQIDCFLIHSTRSCFYQFRHFRFSTLKQFSLSLSLPQTKGRRSCRPRGHRVLC